MRTTHGEIKRINGKRVASPEYRSWQMMKNRCLNPRALDWDYYGGRGVKIDPRWLVFENFLVDMGRRPTPKHTLDRIDNDLDYTPWNCKWSTRKEQSRNRGYYHTCSMELADEIRTLYATGNYYQYELAEMFGFYQSDISQITRNVRWARE